LDVVLKSGLRVEYDINKTITSIMRAQDSCNKSNFDSALHIALGVQEWLVNKEDGEIDLDDLTIKVESEVALVDFEVARQLIISNWIKTHVVGNIS